MRIFLSCQSPLLKKSLNSFLEANITDEKSICDFIISDKKSKESKPLFLISSEKDTNLSLPFLKNELLLALEEFFQDLSNKEIKDELALALKEIKKEQNKKIKKLAKKII